MTPAPAGGRRGHWLPGVTRSPPMLGDERCHIRKQLVWHRVCQGPQCHRAPGCDRGQEKGRAGAGRDVGASWLGWACLAGPGPGCPRVMWAQHSTHPQGSTRPSRDVPGPKPGDPACPSPPGQGLLFRSPWSTVPALLVGRGSGTARWRPAHNPERGRVLGRVPWVGCWGRGRRAPCAAQA